MCMAKFGLCLGRPGFLSYYWLLDVVAACNSAMLAMGCQSELSMPSCGQSTPALLLTAKLAAAESE